MSNSTCSDVMVEKTTDAIEFYGSDVFLSIPGVPAYCVGLAFLDNKINLLHALGGVPTLLTVESPMESGSAFVYDPDEAVECMLDELGIKVSGDGTFSIEAASAAGAKSLTEFSKDATVYSDNTVDHWSELAGVAKDSYDVENSWD